MSEVLRNGIAVIVSFYSGERETFFLVPVCSNSIKTKSMIAFL